nr:alpha/beta hydrolase family protein [uncultured Bacteroides sp.]
MAKKILYTFLLVLISFPLKAQKKENVPYELINNMPLFYVEARHMLTYPMAWGNSSIHDFAQWRKTARKVLLECMENQPPATSNFKMEVIKTEQRKGYTAQKIRFSVSAWSRIPAYLLIPDGQGPFPAVIMLHDHGAHFSIGKEKVVKPFDVSNEVMLDADKWAHACYDDQYPGDYFAANGYVVLAIDALFWGERGRKEGVDYDGQQALASNLMQMGMSFGGIITSDDIGSANFLSTHPKVNPTKIGSLGFSMGSYRSWMLSAASDKIAASASICWMNITDSLMTLTNNQNRGGSAFSMLLPNIRRYMDYPHVASIACPKPTLFFNGTRDHLFPVNGVKESYRIMHKVWKSQNAEDRLVTKIWDEKHFFSRAMQKETLDFFDKWLK